MIKFTDSQELRRFPALFFVLSVVCTSASEAPAQEAWTAENVLRALEARHENIQSVDASIESAKEDLGMRDFSIALDSYKRRVAEFFGHRHRSKSFSSEPQNTTIQRSYYRLQAISSERIRIDQFSSDASDAELLSHLCFNGAAWEHYLPQAKKGRAAVTIGGVVSLPPLTTVLGMGSPFDYTTERPVQRVSDALPATCVDFLQVAVREGLVDPPTMTDHPDFGRAVEVVVRATSAKSSEKVKVFAEVTVLFAPTRGMAPVAVSLEEMYAPDGDLVPFPLQEVYAAEWNDFNEISNGLWIPEKLTVREQSAVAVPKSGDSFSSRVLNGEREIDYRDADIERHDTRVTEYVVRDLKINEPIAEPLCREYAEDTIVEDRTEQTVYQLTEASPAANPINRAMLEGGQARLPTDSPPSTAGRLLLFGNILAIALFAGAIVTWRYLRAARKA